MAEPAVDGRRAEKDARGLIVEIYQTLGRGKTDSLFSLLAERLVVFGPRRIDASVSRSDALVALGTVVDRKAKHHAALRSGGLTVVASPGGHSAWVFDVVTLAGRPLAVTAVLANTDEIWAVAAAAIAAMPSARQLKAEADRDAIVPPGGAAAGKLDPRVAAVVEQFRKGLTDQRVWGDDLAGRDAAVVVGPAAGQIARGRPAIERLWKARLAAGVREATSGEVTAAITDDGQLVWLSVPVTRVADDAEPMPLRIFAIYARAGASWQLTALHEAVALDEPGSGAPFKKILPPAAPPEPKVEPPAPKPVAAPVKKPSGKRGKR